MIHSELTWAVASEESDGSGPLRCGWPVRGRLIRTM